MTPHTTLNSVTPHPGTKASKLSANKTTSATQVARSSKVKSKLVAIRAFCPKEAKARSANVINELSTSRHLARSFEAYEVVKAEIRKKPRPISQPLYLTASGRLSIPIPTRMFAELKIV